VPPKGLHEFIAEATEIVDALGRDLLLLEKAKGSQGQPYLVNGIFRAAHSLKGLAGVFGQDLITQLAHRCEDLLDNLRMGRLELSGAVLNTLIDSVDLFQVLLEELAHNAPSQATSDRATLLAQKLQQFNLSGKPNDGEVLDQLALEPQIRSALTEYEEHRLAENVRQGANLWRVAASFNLSDFDRGLSSLNASLREIGEVISTLPALEGNDSDGISFEVFVGSRATEDRVRAALNGLPAFCSELKRRPPRARRDAAAEAEKVQTEEKQLSRAEEERVAPTTRKVGEERVDSAESPVRRTDRSLRSLTQTVRVDIRRLDTLMNSVGELLLIKSNIQRITDAARRGETRPVAALLGQELYRESRLLERGLDELRKGILDARMVPLSQIFDKLARLVRRIAGESGKEIDFSIAGGDVELDKLIVEELSDPLVHIIRNAIDHGIEMPEVRQRQRKPRRGKVAVRAMQRGNQVVIEVSDDGLGLDHARIREVAISRGVLRPEQIREMNARELQNLIFLPGVSTAPRVSELSGRGVGLDVVKTNIARMAGTIEIISEPSKGSTFTITLPETLAIVRALVVGAARRTYAVPLDSVIEVVASEAAEIRVVERREMITLRGRTIPLMRLAKLLGLPVENQGRQYVILVAVGQQNFGIAVDQLLGQQDIVIKSLAETFQHLPGVAGATDLGNRTTALVVDLIALLESVINSERRSQFL
jgi:two-component system, chemotaxis family, sensor kinase CheA